MASSISSSLNKLFMYLTDVCVVEECGGSRDSRQHCERSSNIVEQTVVKVIRVTNTHGGTATFRRTPSTIPSWVQVTSHSTTISIISNDETKVEYRGIASVH